jgi:hypothetical protein
LARHFAVTRLDAGQKKSAAGTTEAPDAAADDVRFRSLGNRAVPIRQAFAAAADRLSKRPMSPEVAQEGALERGSRALRTVDAPAPAGPGLDARDLRSGRRITSVLRDLGGEHARGVLGGGLAEDVCLREQSLV